MNVKKTGKLSCGVVSATAILFVAIASFVAYSTRTMMADEARSTVENVVKAAVGRIDTLSASVESAVDNSAWIVREHLKDPDYMIRISKELVANNDIIVGSAVAFVPGHYPEKGRLFAPYCNVDATGGLRVASLEYAYDEESDRNEWFCVSRHTGRPHWCEPYFDDGGGEMMMCTYSVPVKDGAGKVVAVLTADVSLEDLTKRVSSLRPYPNSYAVMNSAAGKALVSPPPGAKADSDIVHIVDKAKNGWTVELVCPLVNILRGAQQLVTRIIVFSIVGLSFIFIISWSFSSRLQRATAANERIESELAIANSIQTSLSDMKFPAYASAKMRPAKEVGGDRFDFLEVGDKVYFAIGDASGKGVPAALYTSLVGAGFSMAVDMNLSPVELVSRINRLVSERNENSMFVTYFAGVLDRKACRLDFCNAGHNPPVIIFPDGTVRALEVRSNIALGVVDSYKYRAESVEFPAGAKLLTYTDGVSEAMKADGSQYGMQRILNFAAAAAKESPEAVADKLFASVDEFVAGAEQSDDITVMVVENRA